MAEDKKNINDDLSVLPEGFLVLDDSGSMFQVVDGQLKNFSSEDDKKSPVLTAEKKDNPLVDTGMEEPMLQPPPLAIFKKTASFYFHPDDEEEVGLLAGKDLNQPNVRQFSVQKIVEKAINNFGLKFNLEEKKKFNQLILAVMRDRRSIAETEKLLVDPVESLGMSLPAPLAGGIMSFISQVKEKITKEGGLVVDESQINFDSVNKITTDVPRAVQTNVDKSISSQPKKKSSVIEEIARQVREEMAKKGIQPPVAVTEPVKKQVAETVNADQNQFSQSGLATNVTPTNGFNVAQPLPDVNNKIPEKSSPVAPQNLSRFVNQSKTSFHDIKADNRSLGPIDELALMNLATFRRLSPDATVACQKIGAIVNSLGKQSLTRKTLGIKAWRSSPLYKQYLLVGQTSMETGKPIPEVIADLISSQGDGLSMIEFEAVGDVNRLIRI